MNKNNVTQTSLFARSLEEKIIPYLNEPQAIFILGPRRAGKTSLLKLLEKYITNQPIFYYDLERISDLETFSNGVEYFINRFVQSGGNLQQKNIIMIDEIQYLKDFASFIKIIVDHHSDTFKLILSGSSTAQIKLQFSDSLVGRKFVFHLYPLNFSEFLLFKGYEHWSKLLADDFREHSQDPLSTFHQELNDLLAEYLSYGGYPEVVLTDSEEKKITFLGEITNTYLTKDIQNLNQVEDILGFNRLVKRLALSVGSLLNINEISNDVRISHYLCNKYIQILESTFVVHTITPYYRNKINEIKKMSKLYFIDIGLRNYLLQQFQPIDERIDKGAVLENFVFSQIYSKMTPVETIHFWRTREGKEVDFIIEKGIELFPIEIKAKKRVVNHLKRFIEIYPDVNNGYVFYNGPFIMNRKIVYLPIWLC